MRFLWWFSLSFMACAVLLGWHLFSPFELESPNHLHHAVPSFAPSPPLSFATDFYKGLVMVVEVPSANWLDVWVGEEFGRKRRWGEPLRVIAKQTSASVAVTASFHWWAGDGFLVLGHVVHDGKSIVSPNADLLRQRRCYFAATWDGQFLIDETNLTTGKLLALMPNVRCLVGGGGWLIRDGNPDTWRLAQEQGFRPDITQAERERVIVAINAEGEKAYFVLFSGRVSLSRCAQWLAHHLPVRHAIFFDGGRNAAMAVRKSISDQPQIHGVPFPAPIPCALIVRPEMDVKPITLTAMRR